MRQKLPADTLVLYEELLNETDRGCVLAASAFLEDALHHAIHAKCQALSQASEKDLNKLLRDTESPLSNFSARIRLAHAIGIIDEKIRDVLFAIRNMRNEFAHVKGPKTITDGSKMNAVTGYMGARELDSDIVSVKRFASPSAQVRIDKLSQARLRFALTAVYMDGTLRKITEQLTHGRPPIR